jgi:broad specificity phosphatase PhoE
MRLLLVRHGQTSLNAEGRLAGRLDVGLTDRGRSQAARAAAGVRAFGTPARIIASPLQRARDTAAAIGGEVEVDERWVELDYGELDGLPLSEVPAGLWEAWRADASHVPPGGESLAQLSVRVEAACEELAATTGPEDLVVVVSHVSPIKAAAAWALGVGPETSWRMFVAPASISLVVAGPRAPSLHLFNQTSHLEVPG